MVWLALLLLALAAFAAIWRFGRLDSAGVQLLAAALLLALAGYAWQGRPDLSGRPRPPSARQPIAQTPFTLLRRDLFGRFDAADFWLILAESRWARGDTADAARAIRAGLRARPRNAILWTGYGHALVLHGGGILSPAADLAFRRAVGLAPDHPGPLLFYGLALADNGRFDEAERAWRRALALTPPTASWREGLEQQLRLLDQARTAPR
ncbi:MAG TPA: tetratricopeptide repeat protein [Allosphingosinicella sp.]|nr:tetratricopeptide repeat protein [Allosphingosinicella sp.]